MDGCSVKHNKNSEALNKLYKKYYIHKKKSYLGKKYELIKWKIDSYLFNVKKIKLSSKKINRIPKKFISVFNQESYLQVNTDVQNDIEKGKFETALEHFILFGYDEVKSAKRRIGIEFPLMSEVAYEKMHSDVKKGIEAGEFTSAFEHFIFYGYAEFLQGKRELSGTFPLQFTTFLQKQVKGYFDETAYLNANNDVVKAIKRGEFKNGWDHFVVLGFDEVRKGNRTLHPAIPKMSERVYALQTKDIYSQEK
jgi:hypothetical protein